MKRSTLRMVKHYQLKEYCRADHSQRQNKGFLSDVNQNPIFICGTKWRPREINQSLSLIHHHHHHSYNWLLTADNFFETT